MKYFAHKLCFLIAPVLHRSIVHEAATAFQTWRSQSSFQSFSVNLPWTACRFKCNASISLSFPAPKLSNWLKLEQQKNYRVTPMVGPLRTTQIAFFRFATPCGFFRGSADKVQKVSVQDSVQEKLIWNHWWEHRFPVPDPRVFPPPGDHFLTPTTESPFYDWAAQAAQ